MEIEDNLLYQTPVPSPQVPISLAVTPNNPPWGILEAVGVWIASILFILVIPTLFLLPYLATLKLPITDNEQLIEFAKTDPTSVFLQIFAIIPAHILTILIAWLVVTRIRNFLSEIRLGGRAASSDGGITVLFWVVFLSLPQLWEIIFPNRKMTSFEY